MSEKLSGMRRRISKVEQQVADKARRENLLDCNCRLWTCAISGKEKEFEAEMNLVCPVHGFRQLGVIIHSQIIRAKDFTIDQNGARIDPSRIRQLEQLIAAYEARARQTRIASKHDDSEEL